MCKNCGCNTCESIRGPLLTEGKVKVKSLLSENLQYHLDKNIPLFESVFRIGSDAHLNLIREARKMYSRDIIDLCEEDEALIKTHLGEFGIYEGEAVPLDLPMLAENVEKDINQLKKLSNRKERYNYIKNFSKEKLINIADELYLDYEEYDDIEDKVLNSLDESKLDEFSLPKFDVVKPIIDKLFGTAEKAGQKLLELLRRETKQTIYAIKEIAEMVIKKEKPTPAEQNKIVEQLKDFAFLGLLLIKNKFKIFGILYYIIDESGIADELLKLNESLNEAKKKKKKTKKDPPIGKPKRGGPKAYYVYVRDPKTKRIKKVTFGSGGLRAKIRNPKARKAFAKRHRCSEKNDRTKASYWSCRLPRYASQLGLGANMNTFW